MRALRACLVDLAFQHDEAALQFEFDRLEILGHVDRPAAHRAGQEDDLPDLRSTAAPRWQPVPQPHVVIT